MKKISTILLLSALCLTACRKEAPAFSEKVLVSTRFGGSGWGEYYECISAGITIYTDHTLTVTMPAAGHDGTEQVAELTLTDAQYAAIEKALDKEKLYFLDPKEDRDVCDGDSYSLTLYGADDLPLKRCGGYMPQNEDFIDMYRTIHDNLPQDELRAIRAAQIEKLKEAEQNDEPA